VSEVICEEESETCGELAEIAFMGRAMGMGLIVTQPYGDNARYDFAVDNGKRFKRVQVKSCGALAKGRGSYNVNVGRHTARGAVPYLKSEIHAVAVLIVPEGRWYIRRGRRCGGGWG